MNIFWRRIYFIIIIILIAIIAPLAVMYTAGWRYDRTSNSIIKVGALRIQTEPKGATISLNGTPQAKQTPISLTNVAPGEYSITLSKNGFFPWTGTTKVFASKVTTIPTVYLLNQPTVAARYEVSGISQVWLSPNEKTLAISHGITIDLVNAENMQLQGSIDLSSPIVSIIWSADSTRFAVRTTDKHVLLGENSSVFAIKNIGDQYNLNDISFIQWSSNEPNILYVENDNALFRLNVFQKTNTAIHTLPDGSLAKVTDASYWIISQHGLITYDLQWKEIARLTSDSAHTYSISDLSSQNLCIYDETSQLLYLYDEQTHSFTKFDTPVAKYQISPDHSQIILNNDYEIWIWSIADAGQSLIARTSELIDQSVLFNNGHFIAYSQKNGTISVKDINVATKNQYPIEITSVRQIVSVTNNPALIILTDQALLRLNF